MLRTISRFLSYACLALASALSLVGYASAAESMTSLHFRALAFDSGKYGAESAKLKAELAHMQSIQSDRTGDVSGLISLKNGFVQAFLMKSGVAGGKTGVGAGAQVLG